MSNAVADAGSAVPCPSCGHQISRVVDSRQSDKGRRRRRTCIKCDFRFSTLETIDLEGTDNDVVRMWMNKFARLEDRVTEVEDELRRYQLGPAVITIRTPGETDIGPGTVTSERAPDDGGGDAVRGEDFSGR